MIAAAGVSVAFGTTQVLDEVSLSVADGEWLALIGPNGAGKTTLLRALGGLLEIDAGTLEIDGRPLRGRHRREVARTVALVPQMPETPPGLTVAEYVLLGRTPHLGTFSNERPIDRQAAANAVERLELGHFVDRPVDQLSGGERQRAVLARALAQQAPVLLLDEPTSALDLGHQQDALELVDELRRSEGLTVVAALHDLTLAAQYADRLLLLDGGRVVADGTPRDTLTPARISEVYRAQVQVLSEGDELYVLPARRRES